MISRCLRLFILVLLFSVFFVGKSHAQSSQAPSPPHFPPQSPQTSGPPQFHFPHTSGDQESQDQVDLDMEKARLKKANDARQAQIKEDTDKLLVLATQLKAYVDKTNADILSVDVIKKADEIEKLAHSVKDKMKE